MKKLILLYLIIMIHSLLQANPPGFPEVTVHEYSPTASGYIFLSNLTMQPDSTNKPYLMILNNQGEIVWNKPLQRSMNMDFKIQDNGLITYYDTFSRKIYGMNQDFTIVDSFMCNGYTTDGHEFRILQNGHLLFLGTETRTMDLSGVIPGGSSTAQVMGSIIQEQNENKETVMTWNSFDHISLTDCVPDNLLLAPTVDYIHCNAIEVDYDGNLLVSARHLDEIIKIDRITGDIIWRWGGSASENNEFTFDNDTVDGFTGFSHQHAIRLLANGNYLLFDNGNQKNNQVSRCVEYSLDQVNKIAHKVWEYVPENTIYTSAMGYAQRLSNGNTLIGWGKNTQLQTVTEVNSDGDVLWELSFPPDVYSYRAYRFECPWLVENNDIVQSSMNGLKSYPNPVKGLITLEMNDKNGLPDNITIYDIKGRRICELECKNQKNFTWDLQNYKGINLSSGIYFLRINHTNTTRKILFVK